MRILLDRPRTVSDHAGDMVLKLLLALYKIHLLNICNSLLKS